MSYCVPEVNHSALPSAIQRKLRSIRTRQALFVILRALAVSASVLIVAMVLAMIVDWGLVLFSTTVRVALTTTCLALAAIALLVSAIPALFRVCRATQPAVDADRVVPELEERWTTISGFAKSPHKLSSSAAKAMLRQVTSEAIAMEVLVRPERVARPRVLRSSAYTLCGSVVLLTGFLAIDWRQTQLLFERFWSPTANITATQLESLTGDVTIPRRETLELAVRQSGVYRDSAQLLIRQTSGVTDEFELNSDDQQTDRFLYSLRVDDSFRYRLQAGDAQTPWYDVTVIDYPELAEIQLRIDPPDYVDRPPYERSSIPSRVRVIEGSRLQLRMKPKAPLKELALHLSLGRGDAQQEQRLVLDPDADGRYQYDQQLFGETSFSPLLLSGNGLENEIKRTCRIEVIPDKAPVARIISPTDEMVVAADEVIDVQFEAHDDHGIETAELVVYEEAKEGEEPKIVAVQEIPLDDQQGQQHLIMTVPLDLEKLGLGEGADISYAVRVTDNRRIDARPTPEETSRGSLARAAQGEQEEHEQNDRMASDSAADPSRSADSEQSVASQRTAPTTANAEPDTARRSDLEAADDAATVAKSDADRPAGAVSEATDLEKQSPAGTDASTTSEEIASTAEPSTADPQARAEQASGEAAAQRAGELPDATLRPEADALDENRESDEATGKSGMKVAAGDSEEDVAAENSEMKVAAENSKESTTGNSETKPAAENRETSVGADTVASREEASEAPALNPPASDDSPEENRDVETGSEPQAGTALASQEERETRQTEPPGLPTAPPPEVAMNPQQGDSGQDAETTRRRLKIAERLTAVAAATMPEAENMQIRDRVVAIDEMLADVESGLRRLADRTIPDADRGAQFGVLDEQLGSVERYVADLRAETKEKQFAFVGLQMLEINRAHITPARNDVFAAIRDPNGPAGNATEPLQHIVRAREVIGALLKRYDRVARDRQLAEDLDENIKIYEVYVERMQQLMRERRQTTNPLERKMGIIEVDQDYLDRYAEVLTLRREMMREFGRMLADDPRLLSRYLDLINRRRTSHRDQLSELAARQDEIAYELEGWMAADEAQRDDVWLIVKEMRSYVATELARDVAEFVERTETQLPLALDPGQPTVGAILTQAQQVAKASREMAFDAERAFRTEPDAQSVRELPVRAAALVEQLKELDARFDKLSFEQDEEEESVGYVTARLLESRTVADRAEAWAQIAGFMEDEAYHGLAAVDQRRLEIETELLRVEMLDMETQLNDEFQFQAETELPVEIVEMIHELHRVMESLTLQQSAATFSLSRARLDSAAEQHARALESFERAEELLDGIRRAVVAVLDTYDPDDPNIADLEDPTLDEFLAQLEREPNIEAQLGIPNRPRNLRVIADSLLWQQNGGGGLGDSSEAAMSRAREAMEMKRAGQDKPEQEAEEPTEEQREELARQQEMEEMLIKAIAALEEQAEDPTVAGQQRRDLEKQIEEMRRMLDQIGTPTADAEQWQRLAESDQGKAILKALAEGKAIPDEQWNKLVSELGDGLWQVSGKTPPEEYRKAIEQYQDQIRNLMSASLVE